MMEDYLDLSAYRKDVSWFPSINCKLDIASWQSFTFLFPYKFQMEEFSSIYGECGFRTEVRQDSILCKPNASHDGIIHSEWHWFLINVILWSYFYISSPWAHGGGECGVWRDNLLLAAVFLCGKLPSFKCPRFLSTVWAHSSHLSSSEQMWLSSTPATVANIWQRDRSEGWGWKSFQPLQQGLAGLVS